MQTLSIFDAKTHLSKVVASLASGAEREVRIMRHGKPVVRMIPIVQGEASKRIGCAKGKLRVPADIDKSNAAIARLFGQVK